MNSKFAVITVLISSLLLAGLPNSFSFEEIEGTHAKINYSVKLGPDKYFINFQVCSDMITLESPTILIQSLIDTVVVSSAKILWKETCRTYESPINAKNPDNITFTISN